MKPATPTAFGQFYMYSVVDEAGSWPADTWLQCWYLFLIFTRLSWCRNCSCGSGKLKVNRVTGKARRKSRILLTHSEQTRLACEYHRLRVVSFCSSESVEEMQKSSGEVTSESARYYYFLLYLRLQSFRLTDSCWLIGHFAARFLCFLNWFWETERVCSAI